MSPATTSSPNLPTTLDDLPNYPEIDAFTIEERNALMIVREGNSEDVPVEQLIRRLFVYAILSCSSDVHIDAHGDRRTPRVHLGIRTPKGFANLLYRGERGRHFETKLFQLTNTPQGGSTPEILATRFAIKLPGRFAAAHGLLPRRDASGEWMPYVVSIRVSYIRTYDGFSFVCRLLDQQRTPGLDELGLSYAMRRAIDKALSEPSGLVLVSGPTGSGKTTLLRALLDSLNDGTRSITTVEDPVEYELEQRGPVKQIPIGGEITFPRALRTVVRQDPDVILIGEIRDTETMEIALSAAQTGHLVLATLHANSGPETLSRALDLTRDKGRDAYLLAETVKFVIAQRLLDRYEGVAPDRALGRDERAWLEANGMGFVESIAEVDGDARQGKAALIEAFAMSAGIKEAIRAEHLDPARIYRHASEQLQYETLANAGIRAVQGLGCKVRDCMTRLESTAAAEVHPGLRARLARDHGLGFVQVADVIDAYCKAEDAGKPVRLEDFVQQVKESACDAIEMY